MTQFDVCRWSFPADKLLQQRPQFSLPIRGLGFPSSARVPLNAWGVIHRKGECRFAVHDAAKRKTHCLGDLGMVLMSPVIS